MATYQCKFYDIGNNEITSDDPSLPTFQISTTRGFMDVLKLTELTCTTTDAKPQTIKGQIDWKNKAIAVEGVSKSLSEAKQKIGGTFSLSLEWSWLSKKYTTERNSGVWTAKRGQEEIAVYTSLKVNAFSKNEVATLKFLVDMPNEEKVFIVLALLFHDLQLTPVPEPKSRKQAALEAGGNVAGNIAANVATNALTSCCCVQ